MNSQLPAISICDSLRFLGHQKLNTRKKKKMEKTGFIDTTINIGNIFAYDAFANSIILELFE